MVVLRTAGGPPPLSLRTGPEPGDGERAFLIGFPRGDPGEATVLRMTRGVFEPRARSAAHTPAQIWSETGRTENMDGALPGLVGAPVLDSQGRIAAMILSDQARRARFYSTSAGALTAALGKTGARPPVAGPFETVTVANYGRVADDLRRSRQVAQVLCLLG
jgi:serine protease Do